MKRIPIVILITALFTGIFLLFSTCSSGEIVNPDKKLIAKEKRKVLQAEHSFKSAFEKLKVRNDSLVKELSIQQSKLKKLSTGLRSSQSRLLSLVSKKSDSQNREELQSNCDSLKQQALVFVSIADSTQRLAENHILQLQELVETKDLQVELCNSSYAQLSDLLHEHLEREQKLSEDLNRALRSQRRKGIQNKLLAGGLLILSGISTTLYFNQHN